jgi:hypothetical protein
MTPKQILKFIGFLTTVVVALITIAVVVTSWHPNPPGFLAVPPAAPTPTTSRHDWDMEGRDDSFDRRQKPPAPFLTQSQIDARIDDRIQDAIMAERRHQKDLDRQRDMGLTVFD